MKPAMSTPDLLALLRRHYIKPGQPLPGGTFLPEVGWNGVGGMGRADALYVGFTSTSGRILVGHELKVSRADWLHELNSPGKADEWADQCHEWWLVVADPAIVHDGELPAGWGLMSPGRSKTRMAVHTKPDRRGPDHRPTWDAVRAVIARQDTLRAQECAEYRVAAEERARADIDQRVAGEVERRLSAARGPDPKKVAERLAAVEEALGRRVVLADGDRGYRRNTTVDVTQLARLAAVLDVDDQIDDVMQDLFGRYSNPLMVCKRALAELETALAALNPDKADGVTP